MPPLPSELLARACRTFLTHAYPSGEETVPVTRRPYLHVAADQPIETLLAPPLSQPLPATRGGKHGFSIRLGSAGYPHLKLQITDCDGRGTWVVTVDTHDALVVPPDHPDAPRLAELQAANRCLKEQIESAWEAEGLLTFNGLLRRDLADNGAGPLPPRPIR